ncbi:short-chain dehydrogenase [Salinicola sp. MH3R3-1]|uniref:SDR family oxidoreductase n=1 Tax=Salinicola sp. MH3R3-1 TaxID=1928762 RepID=UPI00094E83EF|nr:SDR family oxidoreductase [Salinicola sp. MH3R3-1]OLO06358.1 short-chain dehydrogenase [Salinicola sp. MH3R3-1]
MARLAGRKALITGGASGIGLATAERFLAEGADVVVLDRDTVALERESIRLAARFASRCVGVEADVADVDSIAAGVEQALSTTGRIDILVNAAGVNVFGDPLELDRETWRRCLAINLEGAWHMIQALLPGMLAARYGHIVNIASVHGHKIVPGAFPYPVAKHGLIGLTRSLGIEYADRGIRVNSISPGLIRTPAADAWLAQCDEQERQRQVELLPCKRLGEADEVANTALFLASDEARFINATDILIDGGRSQVYHL